MSKEITMYGIMRDDNSVVYVTGTENDWFKYLQQREELSETKDRDKYLQYLYFLNAIDDIDCIVTDCTMNGNNKLVCGITTPNLTLDQQQIAILSKLSPEQQQLTLAQLVHA